MKISEYKHIEPIIFDDLIYDKYDLCGIFLCVQSVEEFDIEEGRIYDVNGQGSLFMNSLWDSNFDLEGETYGYSLRTYVFNPKTNRGDYKQILVPVEIMIRFFVHTFRFKTYEEQKEYTKTINRERNINLLI